MPRTISDEEWNYLQQRRQTADFAESVFNDPQLNKDAKRLVKRKYPNLQIPDIDIEDQMEARLAEERRQRDEAEGHARKQKDDEDFQTARKKAQGDYGFTDEAMEKLEKMMVERHIGNYEDAAALMAMKNPPASSPANESRFWRHDQQDTFKEISKDPEKWAENEIMAAIRKDEAREKGWR